ncbi:MAG TPA: hypothetical protein VFY79_05460 [Dehalococcoidia bacterium]|nr:hypothetical protein [Dehalococcoidia bacterium]
MRADVPFREARAIAALRQARTRIADARANAVWLLLLLPFTLVSIAGFAAQAVRTNTALSQAPQRVLDRVGFAPKDLLVFGWSRLINSAIVTHGAMEFWLAVAMIVFVIGAVELLTGSLRAVVTFWGVHIATLLIESLLIALPLALAGVAEGRNLSDVRDVGPSAGYLGVLGLLCALLPRRWSVASSVAVMAVLAVLTVAPVFDPDETVRLSAGIAHLIAFPLGYASAVLLPPAVRRTWRRVDASAEA